MTRFIIKRKKEGKSNTRNKNAVEENLSCIYMISYIKKKR